MRRGQDAAANSGQIGARPLLLDLRTEIRLRHLRRDGQSTGDGLQTTTLTTAAQSTPGRDLHVADFHARDVLALNDLAVVHATAADAGPGEDAEHGARGVNTAKVQR